LYLRRTKSCYNNSTLHSDLGISYVQEVIDQKCNKHHTRLGTHENPLLKTLLLREENRRLKRIFYLVTATSFGLMTIFRRIPGTSNQVNWPVVLDGNPEPDLVHATGCKQPTLRLKRNWPIDLISGTGDSPLDDSPSRHCNNHNISL
jgi:hypothetical protein